MKRFYALCTVLLFFALLLSYNVAAENELFYILDEKTLDMKSVANVLNVQALPDGVSLILYEAMNEDQDWVYRIAGFTQEGDRLFCLAPEEYEACSGVLLWSGEGFASYKRDYLVRYEPSYEDMTTMELLHIPSGHSASYPLRYWADDIHFAEFDGKLLVISQDEQCRRIFRIFDSDFNLVDQGFAPDVGGASTRFVIDQGDTLACFATSGSPEFYIIDRFDKGSSEFTDDRITFGCDEGKTLCAVLACGNGYLLLFKEDSFTNDDHIRRITDMIYMDQTGEATALELPDRPIICALPQTRPDQFTLILEDRSGEAIRTTYQAMNTGN